MKNFIALCIFVLSANTGLAQAANQTIKADINGMVCAFCAQGIEKKIRALPQTKQVYVNLPQKFVAVEINAGQTLAPETITELVKNAGYSVTKIEILDTTVAQIKADAAQTKKVRP
jgi:periplasmic mercuric ion binding protein